MTAAIFNSLVDSAQTKWLTTQHRKLREALPSILEGDAELLAQWTQDENFQKFCQSQEASKKRVAGGKTKGEVFKALTIEKKLQTYCDSLKKSLPFVIFIATYIETVSASGKLGCWRKQAACRLNGLCVIDFDHIEGDVREVWAEAYSLLSDEDKARVLLVYVTPSGHGLKVNAVSRGDGRVDTKERISNAIALWSRAYSCDSVLWRVDTMHLDYFEMSKIGYLGRHVQKMIEMRKTFDHHAAGREASHENNLKFLLNLAFNDGGWPAEIEGCKVTFYYQDKTLIEHPEYQEVDKRGAYHYGYLDLSNPDARKFMVDRIAKYVKDLKADGVYLNSRTHTGLYSMDKGYKKGPDWQWPILCQIGLCYERLGLSIRSKAAYELIADATEEWNEATIHWTEDLRNYQLQAKWHLDQIKTYEKIKLNFEQLVQTL